MIYINSIAVVSVLIMALIFYELKKNVTCINLINNKKIHPQFGTWFKNSDTIMFVFMILTAVFIRFVCAVNFTGHADVNCFKYWGSILSKFGFSSFYKSEGLTDYLPGYLYVLRIVGEIVDFFHLESSSVLVTVLYKMPAMICDLLIAGVLFRFTKKRLDKKSAWLIAALILYNPLLILNSSVWGQIDSVLTLILVLVCIFVYEDKTQIAYVFFCIGFLVKPQMVFFTPVVMYAFFEKCFTGENEKGEQVFKVNTYNIIKQLQGAFGGILAMILMCLPFGLTTVINQCKDTMGSYKYASVNAYNFWGMLGLDWKGQDETFLFLTFRQWSVLFIFLLVFISFVVWISNYKDKSRFTLIGAFLGIGTFTMAVRMHERYAFPAIILLLLLFVMNYKTYTMWLYILFSAVNFINCAHVLFYYDAYNFDARAIAIILTGLLQCIVFGFFVYYVFRYYITHIYVFDKKNELYISNQTNVKKNVTVFESEKDFSFGVRDLIACAVITALYAIIAFYNLGDKNVPESSYKMEEVCQTVDFEFSEYQPVESMQYYLGNYEEREFLVYVSENGKDWDYFGDLTMDSVFRWGEYKFEINTKYIRLELQNDKAVINEIVFRDNNDNIITPVNANDSDVGRLFDEQNLAVSQPSYRNGTIFDEIYHARTGYEFNNGLITYEWTHPPLGKIFIALGMRIFGTSPFGWRFFGTLFGILMVAFIYVLAKKMFKSTFFASVAAIIMATDFMHFTQTRIATIDVFITFFIILMYLFMYWYYTMSFYDTKLYKTFIPLAMCGVAFGLGCASKWTGVYAGAGLAILFFYCMYERFIEYREAKVKVKDGIADEKFDYINKKFVPYFWLTILFCVVVFIIIPGIIYTLSYIPFVDYNKDVTGLVEKMLKNQTDMFNYHKDCIFEHPFSSRWYEWIVMIVPILYYSGVNADGMSERISAFGNPAIWWMGIAAFIFMIVLVKKYKDRTALFLAVGYIVQLLPWTLVVRTTFIYHYFTCVPFIVLMDVYALYYLAKRNNKNRLYAIAFTCICIALFVMFYPAISGKPMSENYDVNVLRWLPTWWV